MEDIRLKEKYELSVFCHTLTRGDEAIVCHTGNGMNIKIPLVCWEVIDKYVHDYTPYDICESADEEDKLYYEDIFKHFIEKKILVLKGEECLDTVDLVITNRCNLQCTHCCTSAETVLGIESLTTDEWISIIDKVLMATPKEITISGGEPMIRSDFFEITNYIRTRFYGKIGLMTNGLLVSDANVKQIVELFDGISISLDGYDEATCSLIRGKGVFSKVLEVVDLLKDNGFPKEKISLSMVETAITYGKTDRFVELCDKMEVNHMIRKFSPIGRGAVNKEWLMKDVNEKKVSEEEKFIDIAKKKKIARPVCQSCRAGRTRLFIDYKGDIFPCMLLDKQQYCLGNVLEIENLNCFISKSERISEVSNMVTKNRGKCSECDVSCFCIYCWAEFERMAEDEGIEAICEHRKKVLEYIWEE